MDVTSSDAKEKPFPGASVDVVNALGSLSLAAKKPQVVCVPGTMTPAP